jgi:hypothetical protein
MWLIEINHLRLFCNKAGRYKPNPNNKMPTIDLYPDSTQKHQPKHGSAETGVSK